jgi:hypothetical protein
MKKVILYEPHSFAYEHELFNSGFIDLFAQDTFIYLLSSDKHYDSIKYMFNKRNIKHIKIAPSKLKLRYKSIYNYFVNFFIISKILRKNKNISEIYILSTWGFIIFLTKLFYWCTQRRKIYFVIHGVLEDILISNKKSIIFRINIFNNIWKCITILHSKDFKYYVLSPHILDNLRKLKKSKILDSFISLIHPNPESEINFHNNSNQVLKIGILGKINLNNLQELDKNLLNKHINIFVYSGKNQNNYIFKKVTFKSSIFIRENMMAENLDFILNLDFERSFHLSCSGTYFESCYFNIPVLASNNELSKSMISFDIKLGIHFNSISELISFLNTISISELSHLSNQIKKTIKSSKTLIFNYNYNLINHV